MVVTKETITFAPTIVELLFLKIMKNKENSENLGSGKKREVKQERRDKDSFVVQNLHLKQINIEELIYEVRGRDVMIDSDLAMIYEEETKMHRPRVFVGISY